MAKIGDDVQVEYLCPGKCGEDCTGGEVTYDYDLILNQ